MTKLMTVRSDNFEQEVLRAEQPFLVDFYADWCSDCKALSPVVEAVAAELAGRLRVYLIDVDKDEPLSERYGVKSIPTLILFRSGKEVKRFVDFISKPELLAALAPYLGTRATPASAASQ